jgi:hypothetical protein
MKFLSIFASDKRIHAFSSLSFYLVLGYQTSSIIGLPSPNNNNNNINNKVELFMEGPSTENLYCAPDNCVWQPEKWIDNSITTYIYYPDIHPTLFEHACNEMQIRFINSSWYPIINSDFKDFWLNWFCQKGSNQCPVFDRNECLLSLQRRPNIQYCSLTNVFIAADIKDKEEPMTWTRQLVNSSHLFSNRMPYKKDCFCWHGEISKISSMNMKKVFVTYSPQLVQFYHTLYDSIGSIIFAMEYIQEHKLEVAIAMDVCIGGFGKPLNKRTCVEPHYIRGMLELLGLHHEDVDIIQHPSLDSNVAYVREATFQCTPKKGIPGDMLLSRTFWYVHKLRQIMLQNLSKIKAKYDGQLGPESVTEKKKSIVVISRNDASKRKVRNYKEIFNAIKETFDVIQCYFF